MRECYALERPFVVCVAGNEHANIEAMIRAYARLSDEISRRHQLAIVGTVLNDDRSHLVDLAQHYGLSTGDLVFTGFVAEDDLVDIYNLCKISVIPSWHDPIGLSALEAMSCGSPVIGAKASSLPEVIGRDDALFDPHDDNDITAKLSQALTDEAFCRALARHGLERAKQFSWDATAKRALFALQQCAEQSRRTGDRRRVAGSRPRPKLAYISPLPPERSGISDYSAELLPELGRHYDIDVVVGREVSDLQIADAFPIRTVDWFRNHADDYDRVLYHFGNSPFHQHMFELLQADSRDVVLHDFFLSSVVTYLECYGLVPNAWTAELYTSHGYEAVWQRFHSSDSQTLWGNSNVGWRYPCNLSVLQRAQGVIVHSEIFASPGGGVVRRQHARQLRSHPFCPPHGVTRNKVAARQALGFSASDFLVCAFGQLGQVKLNQRLLQAWLNSGLARDRNCYLLFVGENPATTMAKSYSPPSAVFRPEGNIRITGWVDIGAFHQYLAAGDIAVQLRTLSRGETSAAVFDCMNHGLATIVNAHGTMAELDGDAVWKLPDEFTDAAIGRGIGDALERCRIAPKVGGPRPRDYCRQA